MKNLLAFTFLLCASFTKVLAQDVSGNWYGIGKVDMPNTEGNAYLTELVLTQKGKTISGQLNYYFRDSLFTNQVTGSFDPNTRALTLKPTNVIYYKSNNTLTGIDCPVLAYFTLRIARIESVLTGGLYADNNFKYTCPTISFKLKKKIADDDIEPIIAQEEVPEEEVDDTAEVIVSVASPILSHTAEEVSADAEKEKLFLAREKTFAREIAIENNVLRLEFYDNGAIDNDSISVFFNSKLVLPKTMLEHKAIKLNVQYDDSLPYNELSMFAESLGLIPPNTAALIIYDGNKRYEVLMTSDFQKNGTIKLVKKAAQ
ncbi:MAG: hypothetical protein KF781_10560 [Chitinophagaceae bacterium]|nr:hypothetical protein [Chitinophagaceae bacterium]MCW5904958.1 hypothetical protein [Chitinophagaceae bacterium]